MVGGVVVDTEVVVLLEEEDVEEDVVVLTTVVLVVVVDPTLTGSCMVLESLHTPSSQPWKFNVNHPGDVGVYVRGFTVVLTG